MKKILNLKNFFSSFFLILTLFIFNFNFINADDNFNFGLEKVTSSYFGNADIPTVISRVIQIVMGLSATVMLVMILYAGFTYLISRGDPKKTTTALNLIKTSVIGIIIIVTAYSLSQFVINNIKFIAS